MIKILEHSEQVTIDSGGSYVSKSFQPQAGKVIGCSIYHNNENGAINPGIVSARILTDAGLEVSPQADIRHYRNREAGYYDGLKVLNFDTEGKTYKIEIIATEPFTDDFKANLVLVYDNAENTMC